MGSSAIAAPESLSSNRGTAYPSHVRSDNAPTRSLSESHLPRDAPQRADAERDGAEHSKRLATSLTKDQGSTHPREGEASKAKDEVRKHARLEEQNACSTLPYDRSPNHPKRRINTGVTGSVPMTSGIQTLISIALPPHIPRTCSRSPTHRRVFNTFSRHSRGSSVLSDTNVEPYTRRRKH